MKTDGSDDRAASRRDRVVSRRSFVQLSGAVLGSRLVGSRTVSAGRSNEKLTVSATEPYRAVAAEAVREAGAVADPDVAHVESAGTDPIDRFREGNADVLVSGRPTLPATGGSAVDGSAAHDSSTDHASGVAASGWAAMSQSTSDWREPLGPAELDARLTDAGPVEAWSETDWPTLEAAHRSSTAFGKRGPSLGDRFRQRSATAWTRLVRGPRSNQYARGRGGVGYFAVEAADMDVEPDRTAVSTDSTTPIVRLGYVHVDQSILGAGSETRWGSGPESAAGSDDLLQYADPRVAD